MYVLTGKNTVLGLLSKAVKLIELAKKRSFAVDQFTWTGLTLSLDFKLIIFN